MGIQFMFLLGIGKRPPVEDDYGNVDYSDSGEVRRPTMRHYEDDVGMEDDSDLEDDSDIEADDNSEGEHNPEDDSSLEDDGDSDPDMMGHTRHCPVRCGLGDGLYSC